MLSLARAFFAERSVLEVQTPVLARHGVTDIHIETIPVPMGNAQWHLQSSPEYAMKRLLAAGSGDIYQIGPAFRAGEAGRRHNPEFTLLEWYRIGFSLAALIDETLSLLRALLDQPGAAATSRSYRRLFADVFGVDALADNAALAAAARNAGLTPTDAVASNTADLRDLMYDAATTALGGGLHVVTDFPAAAAALARIVRDDAGTPVAQRFEVIVDGVEVANGYDELTVADEQRARFEADVQARREATLPARTIDERLLAAMTAGMPRCAGVALGLDRVLMLATGAASLDEVLAFSHSRA